MRRPPLSSPGHHLPRQGTARADIVARLVLLAGIVAATALTMWTLWLAGQLGALVTHLAWPPTTPLDAPRTAVTLMGHLGHPGGAWPAAARPDLAPGWLLYPLWTGLLAGHVAGIATAGLRAARR